MWNYFLDEYKYVIRIGAKHPIPKAVAENWSSTDTEVEPLPLLLYILNQMKRKIFAQIINVDKRQKDAPQPIELKT